MVGLFGALLLASYMLTYRPILKSIATLQAGATAIGSGNLDFKIEERKNDEIGDLSHAFNQMTTDLKAVTASKTDLEREITERKRAEEELRREREWLRVTLSSIGDAVIATDTAGRITFLNPVAEALTSWKEQEALVEPIQGVFRIINEKTHAPAEDLFARVLSEKRVVGLANDTALVTKDGREVPIEDSAAPINDSAGNLIGVVLVFHDVTEKRRAQAALREALERAVWLARFPEENPNPVVRVSTDGNILYCNPASVELPGWECKVDRLLHHRLLPLVGQAMAEGKEVQEDVQLDGGSYVVWVTPFPGEGYANVYGGDITQRKQAEEALRKSEARYRSYIEVTEQLGWTTNADGEVVEDIPSWRKFTGQSQEEVRGWGWSKALHPDDVEHTSRLWKNAVATKNKYEVEYRIRRYDGVYRDFLARGVPIFNNDRDVLEWVGTCIDITERKRAEDALRESEQRLNRAQEIAHLGSWELDLINNRLTWSDEVYRIFGLQPQEFAATYEAFLEAVHPDDRDAVDAAYSGSVREGRDTYEIEHRVVTKSTGETRIVHERCQHIRDASGGIIRSIGMVHDITERKQVEEALRQRTSELKHLTETLEQQVQERTEELEAANEELRNEIDECQRVEIELKKSESGLRHLSLELLNAQEKERKLVAGEIHDSIGSSLSAIKFKVENALTEVADKSPETTTVLQSVIPIVQGAIDEARRIQMNLRPSMLDDLGILATIRWFCRQFESTYSRIRISQDIKIEEHEVPDSLKTVIFRVLQEGLNNVAKHSQAKMVMLLLRRTGQGVQLVIRDNGQGFDLSKVQSPNHTAQGLGLKNMRERTELSGGSFVIESTLGKGTTIRASWPL
jgi:PAS domain S-box-containing protein